MYYLCPQCGKRFKYALDTIPELGLSFGHCPICGSEGVLEKDGARTPDDASYEEVE